MAVHSLDGKKPRISEGSFVAPSADLIGDVEIGKGSSIWFNSTLRGDLHSVKVGSNTSIQDNCVLHTDENIPVEIGDNVAVGHGSIVHSSRVGSDSLIGMNSILLSGSIIGKDCMIGAGSVVTEGSLIPDGSIAMGVPAKVVGKTTPKHKERIRKTVQEYFDLNKHYLTGFQK